MAIEPTEQDIGRKVVYTGNRYPGGKLEEGVITSFNSHAVFVRYGAQVTSQATSRDDLEWITSSSRSNFFDEHNCPRGASMASAHVSGAIRRLVSGRTSRAPPNQHANGGGTRDAEAGFG